MLDYGVSVKPSDDFMEIEINPSKYRPAEINVEGDWSSAAFLIAAGALAGEITVSNLNLSSSQADRVIIDILKSMNARIETSDDKVAVKRSNLRSIEYDMRDCPDLFPIVSALCTTASGTSVLTGLRRLRIKESDRIKSMTDGLDMMGANIKVSDDRMKIMGSDLKGAIINPYDDHRIAMAFAVLSLVTSGETVILDAECVSKSYPGFWDDLESLGSKIRRSKDV
jgi:3-phosphoshikimate 1-carboxyvinyltransferase